MTPESSYRYRHRLARATATAIFEAFEAYHAGFKEITHRAQSCFEQRDWQAHQENAHDRLELYSDRVNRIVDDLRRMLGDDVAIRAVWRDARRIYARFISDRNDLELGETFFNSVTRRIFTTIGVDENLEFVWFGATALPSTEDGIYDVYVPTHSTVQLFQEVLVSYPFNIPFVDLNRDALLVAERLDEYLLAEWDSPEFDCIEMLRSVFYRNKGAYLIGRMRCRNRVTPIILPLQHTELGIEVDALLCTEHDASRVFSFTRSYFHVEADNPGVLVGFLKSMMPLKPIAELYTAIGYNKHGKTALYRALYRHMGNSTDRFQIAPGSKGMVMTVFTLPSYDIVFKIIKDRFAYPKTSTRREVIQRYRLVFEHDRVGRMVDAQEFENLTFRRDRFSDDLLEELATVAANTVTISDDEVIIAHLYTERRLYPLDLYIKEMGLERAKTAVIDYGFAIRDLAAANIFPGDLFIKNFGVTRHGRVVFYDYDELCLLTDCNFRPMPQTDNYDDEMSAQPWFSVSDNDIFPEEFSRFLWFPEPLRRIMNSEHSLLFTPEFWQQMQENNRAGEVLDIYPYPPEVRFDNRVVVTESQESSR